MNLGLGPVLSVLGLGSVLGLAVRFRVLVGSTIYIGLYSARVKTETGKTSRK